MTLQVIFMQDFNEQNNKHRQVSSQELTVEEKQRLTGAFVWLIEQDKKQNPALYQRNNNKK